MVWSETHNLKMVEYVKYFILAQLPANYSTWGLYYHLSMGIQKLFFYTLNIHLLLSLQSTVDQCQSKYQNRMQEGNAIAVYPKTKNKARKIDVHILNLLGSIDSCCALNRTNSWQESEISIVIPNNDITKHLKLLW